MRGCTFKPKPSSTSPSPLLSPNLSPNPNSGRSPRKPPSPQAQQRSLLHPRALPTVGQRVLAHRAGLHQEGWVIRRLLLIR
jgi:hypothetical protein